MTKRRHARTFLRSLRTGLGLAALALGASACVIRETGPVNPSYGAYGYTSYSTTPSGSYVAGSVTVGEPSPAYVSSLPPEPLYETMTPSPGYGYVWVDGYWHWNGYEWVWINGQWVQGNEQYVYVAPYYGYADNNVTIVYSPGYWSTRDRAPRHWRRFDGQNGRPPTYRP